MKKNLFFLFYFCLASLALAGPEPLYETEVERKLAAGIPTDFDSLVRLLEGEKSAMFPTVLLAIPDGRSLVKNKADFQDPRILPVFKNPDLFMGYAPKTKQAEIIAWNQAKGRYEFYLLDQLEPGKTPILKKANRTLCLGCHQNGGPIFSRAPWSETHAGDGNFMKKNELLEKIQQESNFQSTIPLGTGNDVINYDIRVTIANEKILTRKVCSEICAEEDSDCKLKLLAVAMRGQQMQGFGPKENSPELTYFYESLWPAVVAGKFAVSSPVLPDRDPLAAKEKGGLTKIFSGENLLVAHPLEKTAHAMTGEEFFYSAKLAIVDPLLVANENSKNPSLKWEEILGIQGKADPTYPRPTVTLDKENPLGFLVTMGNICFGLSTENKPLLDWAKNQKDLFRALKDNSLSSVLTSSWLPDENLIQNVIFNRKDKILEDCKKQKIPAFPEEKVIADINRALVENLGRPTQIFLQSCSECHQGVGAVLSDYELPLTDFEAMKNYKKDLNGESLVLKYLRDPQGQPKMPPKNASHALSPEDRKILLDSLSSP